MLGILFAFFAALFEATKDVLSKKRLAHFDILTVSWALWFFSLPFLLPFVLYFGIPEIQPQFWLALVVSGSLNIVATLLYMWAIKSADLSTTVPMIAFTPVFLLITSPIILGEFPSSLGYVGILFIVFGSYILHIKEHQKGHLAPLKAIFREHGPKIMLLVAFIWSITSNFDKIGVTGSSPLFWVFSHNMFVGMVLLPFVLRRNHGFPSVKPLIPLGLVVSVIMIFQMTALTLTLVPYVISIKRTSAVIVVVFSHFFLKEKGLKGRLLGAAIMVLGVFFIVFS
ncbi:MAG: DMT family transporter [Nanoarchaeota archaeon]|nr:DMT family transporter [Nanoarchaeota archaeon]